MELGPGSTPLLLEFARTTPAQLKEFYEAMHLIFGCPLPSGAPLGPIRLLGPPTIPPPADSSSTPVSPSGSVIGSRLTRLRIHRLSQESVQWWCSRRHQAHHHPQLRYGAGPVSIDSGANRAHILIGDGAYFSLQALWGLWLGWI